MRRLRHVTQSKPVGWQIIYSSIVIKLMTIFVAMCSYANLENGKMIEIGRSFREALEFFPGATLFERGRDTSATSADMYGQVSQKIAFTICELLRGRGIENKVSLKSSSDCVRLSLSDSLLFNNGTADISNSAQPMLKSLASILGKLDMPIRIEGHSDDSFVKNEGDRLGWELTAMRAINVMRFLQNEANIPVERLLAAGFSKYRPFVPNRTNEDRDRNRRVEISIPLTQEFYERQHGLIEQAPPSFKVWNLSS